MRQYVRAIQEQLKPRYHELTAYLTALTCILLFVFYPEFRHAYFTVLFPAKGDAPLLSFTVLAGMATIGLFFSLIQVFINRKKSPLERDFMGIFIMAANSFAGIAAGIEMLSARGSVLTVIPIANIGMGVVLLYQLGLQKFEVTDEDASRLEVTGASLILLILFAIAQFGFHLTWAITFSICMFYSSTVLFLASWIMCYFRSPLFPSR